MRLTARAARFLKLGVVLLLCYPAQVCRSTEHPVFRDLPFELQWGSETELLQVCGAEVNPEECRLVATGQVEIIKRFYRERFGNIDEEGFWEHSFEGDVPIDRLRRRVLIHVVEFKTIQVMSRAAGLRESISYSVLVARWKAENLRRKSAVEEGGEIYGPTEYSLQEFFDQDLKSLSLALKQRLDESGELEKADDSWFRTEPETRIERMERMYRHYIQKELEKAEVVVNEERFLSLKLVG